jgi:hypothetical protein
VVTVGQQPRAGSTSSMLPTKLILLPCVPIRYSVGRPECGGQLSGWWAGAHRTDDGLSVVTVTLRPHRTDQARPSEALGVGDRQILGRLNGSSATVMVGDTGVEPMTPHILRAKRQSATKNLRS